MLSLGFRLTATGQAADEDGMVLFLPPQPLPLSKKKKKSDGSETASHASLSFPLFPSRK
jgi:hypothetical protein